jgi:predicted transcriptional regulator
VQPAKEELNPAVSIKQSVTPDYIICLEDGKQFKSLKRHLRNSFDLTPDEYREKWGLPYDYPMVAPNYAARRSAMAKKFGLGRKRKS